MEAIQSAWWALLDGGRTNIDLLGYAMQFLPEDHPRLDRLFLAKAAGGCRIRIALANADSRYVAERDEEEGLGGTLRARILTTLDHFQPLMGIDGIELRFHETPMYNSVFRADDDMFFTPPSLRPQGLPGADPLHPPPGG